MIIEKAFKNCKIYILYIIIIFITIQRTYQLFKNIKEKKKS